MKTEYSPDRLDLKIIRELSGDGRVTVTELAKRVGLSKTPCQIRVRKLEEAGIITGYKAMLDPAKLGLDHVAFVEVKLSDTREPALRGFNSAVLKVPEIEQCHMIAGRYDYLLKVRSRDITHYRHILAEVISALPNVANTSTYVSMEAVKDEISTGDT